LAKIIALDIGGKRTGVAETDPLQIIASPRETIATEQLEGYLSQWLAREPVEAIVLGEPLGLDGGDSDNSARVRRWARRLAVLFPGVRIHLVDERYSSKEAARSMIASGVKKQKRREKGALDMRSAAIILQRFLEQ